MTGGDPGPVDSFGGIPEPEIKQLLSLYGDTVAIASKWRSDQVAGTPLRLYVSTRPGQSQPKCLTAPVRKGPNTDHLAEGDDVREVLDHALKTLLDNPNPHMSRNEWLRLIELDLCLTGDSFHYKVRENFESRPDKDFNEGLPEHLYPLDPSAVQFVADDFGRCVGYLLQSGTAKKFIPREDMLYFKIINPEERYGRGRSPLRNLYERVMLSKDEMAYLSALYRNQARPDSVGTLKDASPEQVKATQKQFDMRFKRGGIGGVWFTSSDDFIDFKPLNWSPKDVLGTDLYKWQASQTLKGFGLNDALFSSESSNRAVADTALYMAMRNAILPELRLIEETLNAHLITEFDERLIAAFDNPVPEEKDAIIKEQVLLVDANIYTINEVRSQRGLPPVAWGEEPYQGPKSPKADEARQTMGPKVMPGG